MIPKPSLTVGPQLGAPRSVSSSCLVGHAGLGLFTGRFAAIDGAGSWSVTQPFHLLLFVNVGQPFAGCRPLAFCDFKESFLNHRGNFTAATAANCNVIDGTNRSNFRRGAAEEQFISDVKRGALDTSFFNR